MTFNSQPTNLNQAQSSKFMLNFDRLPELTWFCTAVNIPAISLPAATQKTPLRQAPVPGAGDIEYAPLQIKFLVDEALYTWTTIKDWLSGMGIPENTEQYNTLTMQQKLQLLSTNQGSRAQYTDAMVTLYTNKNNPILQVKFTDLFPVALGSLDFDAGVSAEASLTSTATFQYTSYQYSRKV